MVVTIRDIELNFPNGTDASLFTGSEAESITACIKPSLPALMDLPLDPYFAEFLSLTNRSLVVFQTDRSTGLNFWNERYFPGYKA